MRMQSSSAVFPAPLTVPSRTQCRAGTENTFVESESGCKFLKSQSFGFDLSLDFCSLITYENISEHLSWALLTVSSVSGCLAFLCGFLYGCQDVGISIAHVL